MASHQQLHSRSDVYQAVLDYFSWNPDYKFTSRKAATTRSSTFYDRHLHPDLKLLRVVKHPTLVEQLCKISRGALSDMASNLPPIDRDVFPTAEALEAIRKQRRTIRKESDIEDVFGQLGMYATTVAATLESRSSEWSSGCYRWKRSPSGPRPKALGDAFLCMDNALDAGLDTDTQNTYTIFRDLALWEFKSHHVCSLEIMEAIQSQSRFASYPWQDCLAKDCMVYCKPSAVVACSAKRTGARCGPDALNPVLDLPVAIPVDSSDKLDEEEPMDPNEDRLNLHEEEQMDPGEDGVEPDEGGWMDPKEDRVEQVARNILQQIWSQAVCRDSTFVTLDAGEYEIIGFRHRATQTLYLSETISTMKIGGFGAVQTGLILSIMRDAKARAAYLAANMEGDSFSSSMFPLWDAHYDGSTKVLQEMAQLASPSRLSTAANRLGLKVTSAMLGGKTDAEDQTVPEDGISVANAPLTNPTEDPPLQSVHTTLRTPASKMGSQALYTHAKSIGSIVFYDSNPQAQQKSIQVLRRERYFRVQDERPEASASRSDTQASFLAVDFKYNFGPVRTRFPTATTGIRHILVPSNNSARVQNLEGVPLRLNDDSFGFVVKAASSHEEVMKLYTENKVLNHLHAVDNSLALERSIPHVVGLYRREEHSQGDSGMIAESAVLVMSMMTGHWAKHVVSPGTNEKHILNTGLSVEETLRYGRANFIRVLTGIHHLSVLHGLFREDDLCYMMRRDTPVICAFVGFGRAEVMPDTWSEEVKQTRQDWELENLRQVLDDLDRKYMPPIGGIPMEVD